MIALFYLIYFLFLFILCTHLYQSALLCNDQAKSFYCEVPQQEVSQTKPRQQDRSVSDVLTEMSYLSLFLTNVNVSLVQTMETNKVSQGNTSFSNLND